MTERNEHHTFKADEIPCQEISDPAVLSKNPLVSVKMITYNHELYIAQAIEGVVKQETEYPFELIIGEDFSTDGTMEIVLEYQKKYPHIIRVITSDKNVGMKRNGYRTTKACRGKYIAFCEGDDYWHRSDKLQKQVDYMESHPECGALLADCDVYHDASNKITRSFNYNNGFQLHTNLTIEQLIVIEGEVAKWTCTVMARRNLCEQVIESDPYLHQNENFLMGDTQLWAELSLISTVSYIPETLATYRVLDESVSKSKDPTRLYRFWKSVAEMQLYLYDKHKLSENIRKNAESLWYDRTLRQALHERNADLALKVRKKKQMFTWKEWLQYYGAKHLVFYYFYRVAASFLSLLRKGHKFCCKITQHSRMSEKS